LRPALVVTIAYLLGSIPFGYLIVRATQGADIRETGSGGTGATNVSRRAGKAAGIFTLILDALKGAAAVVIASWIMSIPVLGGQMPSRLPLSGMAGSSPDAYWWVAAAAIAVIIGHMFPVWLGLRGGKGVATGVGVFLILAPIAVCLAAVIFVLIVWRTRYVSLGSIVAAASIPLFVLLEDVFVRPVVPFIPIMTAAAACAILIIFAHRANIRRLTEGSESKFR
jgi:glycerol-3-phosphate acyltransferase PlsY